MLSTSSEDELKDLLKTEELDFRFTCGYSKVVSYTGRDDFVRDICMQYIIYNVHTELSHLKHGLMETLQLRRFAEDHPVELWSLLAVNKKEKKLTAADLQYLFVAVYSPTGSNRLDEERVMMYFL